MVKLPEHIAARVAQTVANLPAHQPYHIDWEAREHGAIALMGTIGSVWLLRPDGDLFDVDSDFGKPLTPLPACLHVTAIAVGCERYPWLRELLPARPANARDCQVCGGSGRISVPGNAAPGIICDRCQALGWLLAE
jgi:hypothetical protein